MIAVVSFSLLLLMALRSLVLFLAEDKGWPGKLMDLLLIASFGAAAALLFSLTRALLLNDLSQTILTAILFFIPFAILLIVRLRRRGSGGPAAWAAKTILVLFVISLTLLAAMMAGFLYLSEDAPVMKVILTGNIQKEPVEWMPPNGLPHKESLDAYEVLMESTEGNAISTLYVYGDQVAVKARIIRFKPVLNLLGFHNLCSIEYVYNGYSTAERFNEMPHHAQEVVHTHPFLTPFQEDFWGYWESLYSGESASTWVKSATLESQYFPLVDSDGNPYRGSFFLTITSGGLSAVPLP